MGDFESSAKRKFIILSACKENLEKSYTNNLAASLKANPPKKENSPRQRRHQEIIKLRPEIKKKRKKETNTKSHLDKQLVLRESKKDRQMFFKN